MAEERVVRLSWDAWQAGRSAKRAALAAHGLSGESRRSSARPEARRQLAQFQSAAAQTEAAEESQGNAF